MRAFLLFFLFGITLAKPSILTSRPRKSRLLMRQPRLGPTLGEVNLNSLQPQTNVLDKANIKASTNRIQEKIEEINSRLTQGEKETILAEASKDDPTGYVCEKQILNITEVSFVEQVKCYDTIEEVCSLIHKTVFETKIEKRCDIEFEKICTNSFKQEPLTEIVHVCTTIPEIFCINETLIESPFESELMARLPLGLEEQCNVHYKTTCETNFEEKEVIEELMTTLKAVPNTNCKSETTQEICITPECPYVIPNKVCEAKERSQVALLPQEYCQLVPKEICTDIVKEYPSLTIANECQYIPQQTCTPDDVEPKEVTKPIIKKVCTATDFTDTMGELTCPDDCTNPSQGICNGYDGTCTCMPGFGGDNCSVDYCPIDDPNYGLIGDTCYYFDTVSRAKLEAKENCIQNYGKLWEPNTIERINQVHLKAKELSTATEWWVGVSDTASEGTFKFESNGEIFPFTTPKTAPWQVTDPNGGSSENCVIMNRSNGGGFMDIKCDGRTDHSICEVSSSPAEIYPCPIDDPQYMSIGPKCYYFDTSAKSKQDAASNCVNNINGRLWEPKEIETMNLVHSKAKEFSQVTSWWVGLSDIKKEGLFQYDSTAQTFPFANGIAPWTTDEPNNAGTGGQNADCAGLANSEDMYLFDMECTKNYRSVCELPSYPTKFKACTASQNQVNWWCDEAYDGIINQATNGWSYNPPHSTGDSPAWAIFELEKATPITSLAILSGQGFDNDSGNGHTLMIFKVTFKVGEKWVVPADLAIDEVPTAQIAIDGTITLNSPNEVLNLVFFPVRNVQAIRLDVTKTNSYNNDLVISEIIPNF